MQKNTMLRSRKRPWPSPGPVRSFLTMYWAQSSRLSLIIPLFSDKQLDNLPPRILRFRLRMAKFHYIITHVPGKLLYTADTLSRSPRANSTNDTLRFEEVEKFIAAVVNSLPASSQRLGIYSSAQDSDPTCC